GQRGEIPQIRAQPRRPGDQGQAPALFHGTQTRVAESGYLYTRRRGGGEREMPSAPIARRHPKPTAVAPSASPARLVRVGVWSLVLRWFLVERWFCERRRKSRRTPAGTCQPNRRC